MRGEMVCSVVGSGLEGDEAFWGCASLSRLVRTGSTWSVGAIVNLGSEDSGAFCG